jgi:hypothetical protein
MEPIKVVAVVSMNGREALVLNRKLSLVYEKHGLDFIGVDGPFRSRLAYSRGGGQFVAFAGRELSLPMADGTVHKCKDHWWSAAIDGHADVATGDIESLKKCYVFTGGTSIKPDDLAELRSTYAGEVYPYWDYEKLLKAATKEG